MVRNQDAMSDMGIRVAIHRSPSYVIKAIRRGKGVGGNKKGRASKPGLLTA